MGSMKTRNHNQQEVAVEIWARSEAKKALAQAGLDDPHPGTVNEYAGKLRAEVLVRGGDREAAAASLRVRLGVGPWSRRGSSS